MRPLMLTLEATLVGTPALIWLTATGPDTVTLLFWAAVLLLVAALGVMLATRARWRRERHSQEDRMAPERAHGVATADWIAEGRQLFTLWQERVERLEELQGRLAAMAQEIDQLRQEGEALLLERDQLRSVLARIGELIQRASEVRPGAVGGAAPEVEP